MFALSPKTILRLIGAGVLTACATPYDPSALSERAVERLSAFERTGVIDSCVNITRIDDIEPLSDSLFLIDGRGSGYYLSQMKGRCSGAVGAASFLQYATPNSGNVCQNQLVNVVTQPNTSPSIIIGSCAFGPFERLNKSSETP